MPKHDNCRENQKICGKPEKTAKPQEPKITYNNHLSQSRTYYLIEQPLIAFRHNLSAFRAIYHFQEP